MAEDRILIEYQRDGTTYSGTLSRPSREPSTTEETLHFTGWEFRKIIRELHVWMVAHPNKDMIWVRRDIPPHTPYKLEEDLVQLIHVDPVRAVRAMSPAPVRVHIRDEVAVTEHQAVRVGHDVIADAFGDWVYVTATPDARTASCLCCGKDAAVKDSEPGSDPVITCERCGMRVWAHRTGNPRWLRVSTEALLHFGWGRYFIPRGWNPHGQWISAAELAAMYDTFKKERKECSQAIEA